MTVFLPIAKEIAYRYRKYFKKKEPLQSIDIMKQWKLMLQQMDTNEIDGNSEHILFVTGYGLGSHYYMIEPIIMQALKQRGAKVSSLICEKSLPACEFNTNGNNKPKIRFQQRNGLLPSTITDRCNLCSSNSQNVLNDLQVETHIIKNYLTQEDFKEAEKLSKTVDMNNFRDFKLNGIAVGEEAYASILRALFRGEVGNSTGENQLKQRYLLSGILTVKAYLQAFQELKPKKIVCIHGVYQIHGLAVKVANYLNIPVDVIGGGGIRKNTIVACHDETYHHQLVNEDNVIWNQSKLTKQRIDRVLKYAKDKRNSGAGVDYLSYHPNPIEDEASLFSSFGINKDTPIIALFTNVIWDAQVVYSSNVFDDIFDWLWTTIDTIAKNKEVTLVIRIHPAEVKGGVPSKQPMLNEIQKKYPKLPINVKIIPPSSDLSSYTVASVAKANIIYGTKMGLEIALMKSPLIIAGETFSRNKGYGYDVTSRIKYIDILNDIEDFVQNVDVNHCYNEALKYADYFYFRRMLDLPLEEYDLHGRKSTKLKFSKISDLKTGNFPALDVICDGILKNKNFYL